MLDLKTFVSEVHTRVPAYARFLEERGVSPSADFDRLPTLSKQNYLLEHPVEDLCWDGSLSGCHLIGSSSGFSKTGSIYWPKRPEDEKGYLESMDPIMVDFYQIDRKPTLELVCLAFGTWFAGMQIASMDRLIALHAQHPFTIATPGLNLLEAVRLYQRFQKHYQQVLWVTNPSNILLIHHLMGREGVTAPPGTHYFTVVGEYYTEAFREKIAALYGHHPEEPFVVWTGYGSADTGDLGVETRSSIRLRKFFHRRPELSEKLFGDPSPPMLLEPSSAPHLEIVQGRIVVTKDQMVPLVRYDTGDAGRLVTREELAMVPGLPAPLQESLPPRLLYVMGRASDSVIFYGTNLKVGDLSDHLFGLEGRYRYAGFFELRQQQQQGLTVLRFTVYVDGEPTAALAAELEASILGFLKGRSLEFATKYEALTRAVGGPLVQVELKPIAGKDVNLKHRYLVEE